MRIPVLLVLVTVVLSTAGVGAGEPVTVSVMEGYRPNEPDNATTRPLNDLMKRDPEISLREWGGIHLPGGAGRSSFLMSLAGGTGPDIYYCWFHIIRNDIRQQFAYPLNEWLGDDANGDGMVDDYEARWEGWRDVPALWRRVATRDGKVYGLPYAGVTYYGLIYRKDLVAAAGMDPSKPPRTWDEFYRWCQHLTYPRKQIEGARLKRGQRAYAMFSRPWFWLPWMQAAGGSPVVQSRTSPTTGKAYDFPMEAEAFIAPDTGEDLGTQPSEWRADFASQAGVRAAAFFHKLRWGPWIRDPDNGDPVDLTDDDIARGSVEANGRTVTFAPHDVFRGVVRPVVGAEARSTVFMRHLIARGEVVVFQADVASLDAIGRDAGVPAELLGMMPFPAADVNHKRVFQAHKHYWAMTSAVAERPKRERDKIWKCLEVLVSEEVRNREIREKVMSGSAIWCRPDELQRLGLDDYIRDIPREIRRFYDEVDSGDILLRTEPFSGFWQSASDLLDNNVLGLIAAESGRDFDYASALRRVTKDANLGQMFELPRAALDGYRPTARVLFGIGVIVLGACVVLMVREKHRAPAGSSANVSRRLLPLLMLAPAVLTIGVWSYYPLVRGCIMAFQEYRIVGESEWVGLNNFILVARDPNFWFYVGKTLKFVGLTMVFGFLTPIVLALLLSEVPRGKIFFRTLFFLPQMTSGIVVALLWKLMYDPTENGVLNQVLTALHLPAQTWLQDPFWAMFCCILPAIWAGAGLQSLIYVAALHSFPDDLYECAALDGAGFFKRVRHITLPQLMPLIIINSVGVFIAAFQNMGHIFLLTFGGPGKETTVLGLAIWKLAYNDLRFSTATTMAWFMGVALIGFTYFQIRFLRKLEFRRAVEN
jgi:ABC-type sugar transport system permease subunit/ABC-type glycerol-3-phosphate transport system substrate-binding protein